MEILTGPHAGTGLENLSQLTVGGSGIGARFQDDERTGPEVRSDSPVPYSERRKGRFTTSGKRSRNAYDNCCDFAHLAKISGSSELACGDHLANGVLRNVINMLLPALSNSTLAGSVS